MTNPTPLFPDSDPHTQNLTEDISNVLTDHINRGNLSWATIIGVLHCAAYNILTHIPGSNDG